ncbi:hypothetical protein PK51_gp33 [Geobacillus phage vB_GthS_PK5.1]|nr:hypothetical protein PK51_gp33 [Geobacillus phage vB_GthS_PK5.1]
MSDLLQEIKDYLYSIRHNAANAALARSAKEYEVCIKTVFDCEEAVFSLFRKLDREYWELLEQFEQAQAKAERYEKALRGIANEQEVGEGDFNAADVANNLIATAKEALGDES